MLALLRLLFGAALLYEMIQGARSAPGVMNEAGDVTGAFYLAVCVGLAILNALVWAPYFGAKVAGPLTGMMTEGTFVERMNWVLWIVRWLDVRGHRRLASWFSFWEGVRHPSSPAPFVIGMRNARPGSWLEKIFAREVFRFDNTQNCVKAYLALKQHGIDPRPHPKQEINIVLLSMERPPRPEAQIIAVPEAAKPAPLKRDQRIRLFNGPGKAASSGEGGTVSPAGVQTIEGEQVGEPVVTGPGSATGPEERPSASWFSNLMTRIVDFIRAH